MAKTTAVNREPEPEVNGTNGSVGTEARSTETENGNRDGSNGNSDGKSGGNFEFVNQSGEPIKRGRGRPPKDPNAQAAKNGTKSGKKKVEDSTKAAKFLMGRLENLSSLVLQKDTSFNDEERFLIEPSLSSILDDMDMQAVEKYSRIINPIVLLFGLGLWYVRIAPKPVKRVIENKPNNDNKNSGTNEDVNSSFADITETRNDNPFISTINH